jgi:uncharacterized protein (TIGR00251 family)
VPFLVNAKNNASHLQLRITPNCSKDAFSGIYEGTDGTRLKVSLKAQPEDGKANKALIKFLSKALKVPQKNIFIIRGSTNRNKTVEIADTSPTNLRQKISFKD